MNRNAIVKRQQFRFMLLNLFAFIMIFTLFGIIIFNQVQHTLFSQTDEELRQVKQMVEEDFFLEKRPAPLEDSTQNETLENRRGNPNPRVTILHWNDRGEIANEDQIGTLLYENYFEDFTLEAENEGTIINMVFDDTYHYRSLLFENHDSSMGIAYTQLLVNIDPEQTIIDNFGQLLIICSLIFVVLSISASYILSKKMVKPIIQSWNKQAEFVENASHELRTPLTVIQNKMEMLLTVPQAKIMDKFENIAASLSETRRLSKLTTDLLTLARADSAEIQLQKETIRLDTFIREAVAPYKEIAESQSKDFQLNLQTNTELEADQHRIHQLLVILLDNALKYTAPGERIGINSYADERYIVIEVSDEGAGIKAENLPYIFDRFYREDKARSRETGGIGLGLSIAQWIVESHGGTITASKNKPEGTVFQVKLPT
ncbi:sensor histidine kinase [Jeotgalibacillus sp. JSM ZJ347]|uniref:sensor histidine kinase n=1 Tax=Jeotgalibacillus sp. JSM ZJ347 TaxID=3342117 RepID=UPI0035A9130B